MKNATKLLRDYIADESGATAVEYGLIAALIGMGTILGMGSLASNSNSAWNALTEKVGDTVS